MFPFPRSATLLLVSPELDLDKMAAEKKPTAVDPAEKTNMGVDYVISYRFAGTGKFEII